MRPICFRAVDVFSGKVVFGDLVHNIKITKEKDLPRIMVGGYEVYEDSISQFTGLNYADGEPIYEKDKVCRKIGSALVKGRVVWDRYRAGFVVRYDLDGFTHVDDKISVGWEKVK